MARNYQLKVEDRNHGISIGFYEVSSKGTTSPSPSVHCRLSKLNLEEISKLPVEGGVYSFRDVDSGIMWDASKVTMVGGLAVHLVCRTDVRSSADGYIPAAQLKIASKTEHQSSAKTAYDMNETVEYEGHTYHLTLWLENDRLHLNLKDECCGKEILDVWDDDAQDLIQSLEDPRDILKSVLKYADSTGLLKNEADRTGSKSSANKFGGLKIVSAEDFDFDGTEDYNEWAARENARDAAPKRKLELLAELIYPAIEQNAPDSTLIALIMKKMHVPEEEATKLLAQVLEPAGPPTGGTYRPDDTSASRNPDGTVNYNGKTWTVEENTENHAIRLVSWKGTGPDGTDVNGRWIDDMVEMPKSYFDNLFEAEVKTSAGPMDVENPNPSFEDSGEGELTAARSQWKWRNPNPTNEELIEAFNNGLATVDDLVPRIIADYKNSLSGTEPDAEEFRDFLESSWQPEIAKDLWAEVADKCYDGISEHAASKTANGISGDISESNSAIDGSLINMAETSKPATTPIDHLAAAKGPHVNEEALMGLWTGGMADILAVPRGSDPSSPNTPALLFEDMSSEEWILLRGPNGFFKDSGRYEYYLVPKDTSKKPLLIGEGKLGQGIKLVQKYDQMYHSQMNGTNEDDANYNDPEMDDVKEAEILGHKPDNKGQAPDFVPLTGAAEPKIAGGGPGIFDEFWLNSLARELASVATGRVEQANSPIVQNMEEAFAAFLEKNKFEVVDGVHYESLLKGKQSAGVKTAGPTDIEHPAPEHAQAQGSLVPFTKQDWYGWGGATRFDHGWANNPNGEPLIAWISVGVWPDEGIPDREEVTDAAIIVDAEGISVNGNNAAFILNSTSQDDNSIAQNIELANRIAQGAPIDYTTLVKEGFSPANFPREFDPKNSASGTGDQTASGFDYKTELKTPDGYEIQSGNKMGRPAQGRFFTVWPPEGNAVGTYDSMDEATTAIDQWKQFGDPELLKRDGGAQFKIKK